MYFNNSMSSIIDRYIYDYIDLHFISTVMCMLSTYLACLKDLIPYLCERCLYIYIPSFHSSMFKHTINLSLSFFFSFLKKYMSAHIYKNTLYKIKKLKKKCKLFIYYLSY